MYKLYFSPLISLMCPWVYGRKVLLVALAVTIAQGNYCFAQAHASDTLSQVFVLPANTNLNKVDWRDSIYRFPSFQSGRITFATGYSPPETIRANYNLYFAQMDFINSEGDTLQIKPTKELKMVTIGDHLFLYDYNVGYTEIIQQLPVALGVRHFMIATHGKYAQGDKFGIDDLRGTTAAYDRFYQKVRRYYFIGTDNKSYKATANSLFKVFPAHKKEVKKYLKDESINFNKKEDVTRLIVFCNELDSRQ